MTLITPASAAVGVPEKVRVAGLKVSQAALGLFSGGVSQGAAAAAGIGEGVGREGVGEGGADGSVLVGDEGGEGGHLVESQDGVYRPETSLTLVREHPLHFSGMYQPIIGGGLSCLGEKPQ